MKNIGSKKTCFGILAGASFVSFIGLTIVVMLILFICFGFIQIFDEVTKSIDDQPTGDDFFMSQGGWDYRRIALIEPYHAIDSNNDRLWTIDLKTDSIRYQFSVGATELDVIDNKYIVTYAPNSVLGGEQFDEVWFIIIPEKDIEKGFTTEEKFLTYLKDTGIDHPNLTSVNELYKELGNKGYLKWFPEDYKK